MMTLEEMRRDERSLLLFFESCAVDLNGRVDAKRMNEKDFSIAKDWDFNGFICFGRIVIDDHNSQGGNWVELSEDAWSMAHQERRARHARGKRRYKKTYE